MPSGWPIDALEREELLGLDVELVIVVRRQGFWDNMRFELAEVLAHQGCHFMLPLLDEASGAV